MVMIGLSSPSLRNEDRNGNLNAMLSYTMETGFVPYSDVAAPRLFLDEWHPRMLDLIGLGVHKMAPDA